MAQDQNISIKIGIDTSNFDGSIKGMTQELKALAKVDLTLLSPQDAKATIARMGDLKDQIGVIRKEIQAADPSAFFSSFSTLAGPAVSAISGLGVGMEMFGAKTEEVDKIQRKLMALISLISTMQTLADANKLKGIMKQIPLQALELKNRITNALLIKQEVAAQTADLAIKDAQATSVKTLTTLQLLWNKAVASNPILIVVAGITALIGAIALLSKAFKKNNEEVKESEKALDGTIIKNEELRKAHNETINTLRDLDLEIQKTTGSITEQEYELGKLQNKYQDTIDTINQKYIKTEEEATKKSFGFWNTLKNQLLSLGNPINAYVKNAEDAAKKLTAIELEKAGEIKDAQKIKDKELEKYITDENKKILDLTKELNKSLITSETEKAQMLRDEKLKEVAESKATEKNKADAILAIYQVYFATLDKLEADRSKKESDFLNSLVAKTKEAQEKLKELQRPSDELTKLEAQYVKELEALKKRQVDEKVAIEDFNKEKEQLDAAYAANQQAVLLQSEKDKAAKLLDFQKTYLGKTLQQQKQAELDKVDLDGKGVASVEDIAKAKLEIEKKYSDQTYEYKKNLGITTIDEERQRELDSINKSILSEEEYRKAKKVINDKYDQMELDNNVKKMETLDLMNQAALAGLQIIADQQQANSEAELARINAEYDTKKTKLDEQLEYGLISQKEYDAALAAADAAKAEEEKKAKIKAAKQEKIIGLFQIAINTAMAVMKAFATLGPIAGAASLPFIIGTGIAEAAVVAAKPIPAFQRGGKVKQSGPILVGEKGPEIIEATAGSNVIPNTQINNYSAFNKNGNGVTYDQMATFVGLSFANYKEIPINLKLTELDRKNAEYQNIKINSTTT